jgi:hypothetical protein
VEHAVLAGARENAHKAGFFVTDLAVTLNSDDPRSLAIDLHVGGLWILLPTAIDFHGQVDVDDNFNAHLSRLSCTGNSIGGPILASLINSAIKKYEGRVMPLAAFPGNKIHLHDLAIHLDDSLRIKIGFGT